MKLLIPVDGSVPSFLALDHALSLCQAVSRAHRCERVVGAEERVARARWAVLWTAKRVMERTMRILGLFPVYGYCY